MVNKLDSNLKKLLKKGKALFLADDQGLEHGPADFKTKEQADPNYIINIAKKGKFTGIVFQKGIAEKYKSEIKKSKIPLIVKLNGKTNIYQGEPLSKQLCTVKEAIKLGAAAVGYTIYIGSKHEASMLSRFSKIQTEAHKKNIPVIAWIYPRGKDATKRNKNEMLAYATRVGLELGADIIKVHYPGNAKALKWAVQCAGKAKVVIAGGVKTDDKSLKKNIKDILNAGGAGLAIGRNIWQSKDPIKRAKKIREIIFNK